MNTRKIMDNARAALADTRTPADVAVDGAIDRLGNAVVYAIQTANGYVAQQGNTHWFQDAPTGWAVYGSEGHARDVAESLHSAIGTAPDEGYSIVAIPAIARAEGGAA